MANEKEDVDQIEKLLISIEHFVYEYEVDHEKIENMKSALKTVQDSGLFSADEIEELRLSYNIHFNEYSTLSEKASHTLQVVRKLLQRKKAIMSKLWDEKLLDKVVEEKWIANIKRYESRVKDLESKL